jgi:hypothetical protein
MKLASELHDELEKKFGSNWRRDMSITLRLDQWYWLVFLIEHGIAAKREEFKKDTEERAIKSVTLGSWECELEELVKKIREGNLIKPKGRK